MIVAGAVTSVTLYDGAALAEIADDDGSGSGLDADYLDGLDGSSYQPRMAVASSASGATTYLTPTCQNYSGGTVTIVTSGAGTVIVNAQAWMQLTHVAGTDDNLVLAIGLNSTDCSDAYSVMEWTIPGSYPASTLANQTFHVQRSISVPGPGTYTYYLNGYMGSGSAPSTDRFWFANMNAVYYP